MAYQKPTEAQDAVLIRLEGYFAAIYDTIKRLPDGRRKSIAITELEGAEMWTRKAVVKGDEA